MKKYIQIIFVILSIVGCKQTIQNEKETHKKIPVVTSQSIEKEYIPEMTFSGTAYANKEANLGTAIPGRVEKIFHQEGDHVNKGDLLVELSSELYLQALIEHNALKKDFERVSRLREKGSLSEQDFDHVKAKYDASVAKTEMMKKNAEIRAPFKGIVVDHIVKEGENFLFAPSLKPGYSMTSGIIKIMQLDLINVEIDINEKEISKINKNQKASVVFDAFPEKIFRGKVVSIDPILSTLSRTATCKVRIENKKLLIKPGMYAKVNIQLPKENGTFVPNEAIYRQPGTGNDFVYIVQGDSVLKTTIERMYTLENLVAVDGIEANTPVVIAGKSKLQDGMKVEVKEKRN